jgi:hypothetical protein
VRHLKLDDADVTLTTGEGLQRAALAIAIITILLAVKIVRRFWWLVHGRNERCSNCRSVIKQKIIASFWNSWLKPSYIGFSFWTQTQPIFY